MGKIILVLGGARSGKSSLATELAKGYGDKIAYIATSPYFDEDMIKRIEKHKQVRPSEWTTYEEEKEIPSLLKNIDKEFKAILLECITLYISNLLLDNNPEDFIQKEIASMLNVLKSVSYDSIIVSNEVGLGVHPDYAITREFRDIAGRVNQIIAKEAEDVYFVVAGIPIKIKDNNKNIFS